MSPGGDRRCAGATHTQEKLSLVGIHLCDVLQAPPRGALPRNLNAGDFVWYR